jgi:hypothetical protein
MAWLLNTSVGGKLVGAVHGCEAGITEVGHACDAR